jgi:hypothetical protein
MSVLGCRARASQLFSVNFSAGDRYVNKNNTAKNLKYIFQIGDLQRRVVRVSRPTALILKKTREAQ